MSYYQVQNFLKTAEKDNYKNGCTGDSQDSYITVSITGRTLTELITKCLSFTNGDLSDDLIENNRLDFQVMENAEGYKASPTEMEQFKKRKIDLWLCDYSCIVEMVGSVDLTDEFNLYHKGI